MQTYGVPYKGGKNVIAEEIIKCLPKAKRFYDLFAGGCAITHCAMLSKKYEYFHINDLDSRGIDLFMGAIRGDYKDEHRVINKEEFNRLKDIDPLVSSIWSFGYNQTHYLWNPETAAIKELLCRVVMGKDLYERQLAWRAAARFLRVHEDKLLAYFDPKRNHECSESLEVPNRLWRVQSLEGIYDLEKVKSSNKSYKEVEIEGDSIVYCDPPYKDTQGYKDKFDHKEFYDWLRGVDFPVYVSEYKMPEDFVCIKKMNKRCCYSSTNNSLVVVEKVFLHKRWKEKKRDKRGDNNDSGFQYSLNF